VLFRYDPGLRGRADNKVEEVMEESRQDSHRPHDPTFADSQYLRQNGPRDVQVSLVYLLRSGPDQHQIESSGSHVL
jgi:hypothetical protein